ncbi:MAG TPA: YbdD/YjiX family protein [Cellulomonas sp.]|uniref:YbdD/YjiX family protein n=1 Tax=Cellulomonas sp. TaxID=40001 RepID=UPI002E364C83|nr:YbdD/YjiX family protein [Cellulomonas sp.]HEX5332681.1 YbdD/YjiX family protein [Cellulomonas sp.]
MDVAAAVRQGARGVSWFVKGMLGEDAYDKYVEHHAAQHDGDCGPVMTEREFWRDVTDRQERNPQGRCC